MVPKKIAWLLVGDGAKAQLYSIRAMPLRLTKVPAGGFRNSRKVIHAPVHKPESRHIAHTGHGLHQRHEDSFVERVAAAVETAADEGRFDSLIVVLPPKALARFRKIVGPNARKKIKQEIRSEWTHLTLPEVEQHLTARLP